MPDDSRRRRFPAQTGGADTAHENQLRQRLTGSPTVSRVQTLQTIRTSRLLAGVPFRVAPRPDLLLPQEGFHLSDSTDLFEIMRTSGRCGG